MASVVSAATSLETANLTTAQAMVLYLMGVALVCNLLETGGGDLRGSLCPWRGTRGRVWASSSVFIQEPRHAH